MNQVTVTNIDPNQIEVTQNINTVVIEQQSTSVTIQPASQSAPTPAAAPDEPDYDTEPSSEAYTYLANGEVDTVTFYDSLTQATENKTAFVQMNYDVNLNPTTEVWTIYDEDGIAVLAVITFTYTFTGDNLTKTEVTVA